MVFTVNQLSVCLCSAAVFSRCYFLLPLLVYVKKESYFSFNISVPFDICLAEKVLESWFDPPSGSYIVLRSHFFLNLIFLNDYNKFNSIILISLFLIYFSCILHCKNNHIRLSHHKLLFLNGFWKPNFFKFLEFTVLITQ